MEDIKYAIFDVDGTLMDSMHIWDTAAGAFLMMRGIQPLEKNVFRSVGYAKGIDYLIKTYNLPLSPEQVKAEIVKVLEFYYYNIAQAKPGVKRFLERMRAKGVHMTVATATDRFLIEPALERNGLLEYFDRIFTCTEVGTRKFEPTIYNAARDYMGADSGLFVFEDAAYAIDTAKQAGYNVIAVEDYSAQGEREHIREVSDYYITNYDEIYKYLNL